MLALAPGAELPCTHVPGFLSKLLFSKGFAQPERFRNVRAIRLWLMVGLLIVAAVVGLLYLVCLQHRP